MRDTTIVCDVFANVYEIPKATAQEFDYHMRKIGHLRQQESDKKKLELATALKEFEDIFGEYKKEN